MKQGGTKNRIKQILFKIYGQYFEIIRSFSHTCFNFLKLLLQIIKTYVIHFLQLIIYFTNCNLTFMPGTSNGYPFFKDFDAYPDIKEAECWIHSTNLMLPPGHKSWTLDLLFIICHFLCFIIFYYECIFILLFYYFIYHYVFLTYLCIFFIFFMYLIF